MKGLENFLSDITVCLYGSRLVDSNENLEKFSNPAIKYLYVSRSFEVSLAPVSKLALVVVKRTPILSENESWGSQLQLIHLPDATDTTSTLSCMVQAMNPILSMGPESKSLSLAKKKCSELELSLSSLDEAQLPAVNLDIDPQILELLKDPNFSLNDMGPLLEDSSWLNRLQGHVNNWIKEIQKVTSLSREMHTSSISEIMFWGNLEGFLVLLKIRCIIKYGKEFAESGSWFDSRNSEICEKISCNGIFFGGYRAERGYGKSSKV